ncbi:MAG: preprotein translocase subunit SecY [Alphaproteobacteria bacterium]|jgi:preprotein translocase subunit SecY
MTKNILSGASDLKSRLLITFGILMLCRLGSYITIPGINVLALGEISASNSDGVLGIFNMLSGGALSRMSIFALAIMPYITASIVMQLLSVTFKPLEEMKKEGEAGKKRINQYTRYLTVFLTAFQAYGIAVSLEKMSGGVYGSAVMVPGAFFRILAVSSLIVGTMFLMWLGEQISARGIGNGTSLIIFTGIVSGLPQAFVSVFELTRTGAMSATLLVFILVVIVGMIYFIVFMERAQRKIPVQYPKRQIGNKLFAGDSTHLPLKLNTSGVIPPIFASSILLFPLTISNFVGQADDSSILETISMYLGHGKPLYILAYVILIVFFCFFYTAIIFNVDETAENLRKNGGFIFGRRPGKNTAEFLDFVLTRLTVIGAAYIAFICALPEFLSAKFNIPFSLGGTSFLIVVNVVIDTFTQVQTALLASQYEGLIKKSRLRDRAR